MSNGTPGFKVWITWVVVTLFINITTVGTIFVALTLVAPIFLVVSAKMSAKSSETIEIVAPWKAERANILERLKLN